MPKRSHLVLKMAEGPRPFRNPLCTWTPRMATFEGTRSPKCCPWTNQGHLTFQHTPPWPRPNPWDAYTRAYTNRGDPARLIRERPVGALGGASFLASRPGLPRPQPWLQYPDRFLALSYGFRPVIC